MDVQALSGGQYPRVSSASWGVWSPVQCKTGSRTQMEAAGAAPNSKAYQPPHGGEDREKMKREVGVEDQHHLSPLKSVQGRGSYLTQCPYLLLCRRSRSGGRVPRKPNFQLNIAGKVRHIHMYGDIKMVNKPIWAHSLK